MRVTVDNYIYSMIKITSLERLNITSIEYKRLSSITQSNELLIEINKFFPNLSKMVEKPNLIEIEKALFEIYFKIYRKVLMSCPPPMQMFLVSLLKRFEIWNIKTYIMGLLIGKNIADIKEDILYTPEKILYKDHFINKLLSYNKLEDGINFLKKTSYFKAINRGYNYFEQRNETFLIEALLDKHFVNELFNSIDNYGGIERELFENYIHIMVLKYNLMVIFRSIVNKVPKSLLKQLIIKDGMIISINSLQLLIKTKDRDEFFITFKEILQKIPELRYIIPKLKVKDPITRVLLELNNNIFKDLNQAIISDLEKKTIEKILILILHKEGDIFKVLRLFVKIFHKIKDYD